VIEKKLKDLRASRNSSISTGEQKKQERQVLGHDQMKSHTTKGEGVEEGGGGETLSALSIVLFRCRVGGTRQRIWTNACFKGPGGGNVGRNKKKTERR